VPSSTAAADGYACDIMLLAKASKILGKKLNDFIGECYLLRLAQE